MRKERYAVNLTVTQMHKTFLYMRDCVLFFYQGSSYKRFLEEIKDRNPSVSEEIRYGVCMRV